MRIALFGKDGQVGHELSSQLSRSGELLAPARAELDLSDAAALRGWLRQARPAWIVNAAAYTAVDRAESEPALAHAVNAIAPEVMAEEAKRTGALLVHYSTDYVFDGQKPAPYVEYDLPNPLGIYGATKLAGEQAITSSGCRHAIFRVSWVYGARGRNFLLTMLKLAAERPELKVVNDQIGAPTWCRTIARVTADYLTRYGAEDERATYHFAASGSASWFEFAQAIVSGTKAWRKTDPIMTPISTREYPTPARRPQNSRLDTGALQRRLNAQFQHWKDDLDTCLSTMQTSRSVPVPK